MDNVFLVVSGFRGSHAGRTTTADPIVFCRVKNTAAGAWKELTNGDLKDSVLAFPRFQTELVFEAYTACGKLGDLTWNIYVHRTEVVRIPDWWFSMWDCGVGKCDVEPTDFRVCKLMFDPKSQLPSWSVVAILVSTPRFFSIDQA